MKPVAIRKSRPVAIRKSRPVAVKKSMTQGYDSSGKPIMMFGGGGGGATPTYLSSILGGIGGIGGAVLGALGPHRSLAGLAQGVQSGAYTGRDIGRAAGGITRVIPGARRRLAARGARREADDAYRAERTRREVASGKTPFLPAIGDYMPNLMTHGGRAKKLQDWQDEQTQAGERAKRSTHFSPENIQHLTDVEYMKQKIRAEAKEALEVGRSPVGPAITQSFAQRDDALPDNERTRRAERILVSAGGQGSPASGGNVIVHPHNQMMGEEDVTGPYSDHRRDGLEELTEGQKKFEDMKTELSARGQLGIDKVRVRGQPADASAVATQEELIQRETDNNPLNVSG